MNSQGILKIMFFDVLSLILVVIILVLILGIENPLPLSAARATIKV
jgi:hypothetical protein